MDNNTIDHILRKHPSIGGKFGGVFACDELPKNNYLNKDLFYVVNTDASHLSGQHWLAVYINSNGRNELFDSYGNMQFPPKKEIQQFLNYTDYIYSLSQLQHNLSTVCGQYCVFYIWQRSKGKSLSEIVNLFQKEDFLANDVIVNSAVEQEFNIDEQVINHSFLKHFMKSVNMREALAGNKKMDKMENYTAENNYTDYADYLEPSIPFYPTKEQLHNDELHIQLCVLGGCVFLLGLILIICSYRRLQQANDEIIFDVQLQHEHNLVYNRAQGKRVEVP